MKIFTRSSMAFIVALALIAGGASIADAKSPNSDKANKAHKTSSIPLGMRIQIAITGKAHLEGTVQSIGANSFTVNTWGGVWTITTSTSTKYTHKSSIASIRIGDQVKVQGTISPTATNTVIAKQVDNKTNKKNATSPVVGTTTTPVLGLGVVSSTGTSTLVVTRNNSTSTINILTSSSTVFLNKLLVPITFSQILTGHAVAVSGTTTATSTISATVIQDLSI